MCHVNKNCPINMNRKKKAKRMKLTSYKEIYEIKLKINILKSKPYKVFET